MFRSVLAPRLAAIVLLLLLLEVPLSGAAPSAALQTPLVHVSPALVVVPVGDTTCVDLRIENVENLFGFGTVMRFDPSRMVAVKFEVGPFLQDGFVNKSVDNTRGTLSLGITLFGTQTGRSGSGVLATACFQGLNRGHSAITLVDSSTMLLDPNVSSIPFATKSGGAFVGPVFQFRIPLVVRGN